MTPRTGYRTIPVRIPFERNGRFHHAEYEMALESPRRVKVYRRVNGSLRKASAKEAAAVIRFYEQERKAEDQATARVRAEIERQRQREKAELEKRARKWYARLWSWLTGPILGRSP